MARKTKQKRVSIKQSKTEWEKKKPNGKVKHVKQSVRSVFGLQHYLNFHGVIADIRFLFPFRFILLHESEKYRAAI